MDMLAYSAFRVPSASMEPTIHAGELVYVDTKKFNPSEVKPGDVVAYKLSSQSGALNIKRVAALGGSTVQLRRWKLVVDGQEVKEPYVDPSNVNAMPSFEWGPQRMPPGCVFVLGDNRDGSRDSREHGCVPTKEMIGLVRYAATVADPRKARQVK